MTERHRSPEQPIPPEMLTPISPEDQAKAEESLEEFREEKRQNILAGKKMTRSAELDKDYADHDKKTLKTRHAGPVAKAKRAVKEISDRFDKPALKIKIKKEWDDRLEENK